MLSLLKIFYYLSRFKLVPNMLKYENGGNIQLVDVFMIMCVLVGI
ncbi:hypothetical protein GYH30_029470 [Glycine max]|nr:hypothetical protein GYH30_029470 [Glycine max]